MMVFPKMMLKVFQDDIHGIFRCPTVLNLFEGCYAACSEHFAGEKDHVAYLAPGWDPLGDFHGPYSHQRLIPVLKMHTHNHHMFSFYDVYFWSISIQSTGWWVFLPILAMIQSSKSASLQELVLGTHLGGNPIGPAGVQATETWDHRRDPLVICYSLRTGKLP